MRLVILFTMLVSTIFNAYARDVSEYNLNNLGEGLIHLSTQNAYDPVSFFPEGGASGIRGTNEFALDYHGVTYLFANNANRAQFQTNSKKYEPTYGGWCARAMVVGQKVAINTNYYTIDEDRIYFFVNSRAKRFFDRDVKKNARLADEQWRRISGEEPRL